MPNQSILILGIDPGLAKGKPMAMALVEFPGRELLGFCDERVEAHRLEQRLTNWTMSFARMALHCKEVYDRSPDMVAIEDVRARGRGGAHMQCLITFLKERADGLGIRVEPVNPSSVKLHATGYGAASTEDVAIFVRSEYKGADKLPQVAGEYDMEMAVAIAGAGYAVLQKEERGQ